ncbi:MAG: DNA polymerase Y family protein [Pseudomonadota bacterium]
MVHRRILSIWFPRMGAERLLRLERGTLDAPLAVVEAVGNAQFLSSLSAAASAEGLTRGQPVRDAQAMCPALLTRLQNRRAEAEFLSALRRWAGKFSPWVAQAKPDGLTVDLTGCAHLFGGELQLLQQLEDDCADLGLSVAAGIADTPGAAWALARFAGRGAEPVRSGDAIDQEAHATRSRAVKRRHWERGGPAPKSMRLIADTARIAEPGQTRQALSSLPVAALRIEEATATELARLGLRRIGDLIGQPRAALARRFGQSLVRRLDQALGVAPEPVAPSRSAPHFGVRLSFPDPIGLVEDIMAGIDRLLPALETRLKTAGRGARMIQLDCSRADHTMQSLRVGLARPSADPDRIRPLLMLKIDEIDAGFGIDRLRLEATQTEPIYAQQHRGHAEAAADGRARMAEGTNALDDLIGRIGARIGLEAITRRHPGDSHIPEKAAVTLAAAWSEPAQNWPTPTLPRPLLLWRPELVDAPDAAALPIQFRWRRQPFEMLSATGPERIAPEWWLDEPEWRSGTRDYWRVTTTNGKRLWLYYAHGGTLSSGWFCQGQFA